MTRRRVREEIFKIVFRAEFYDMDSMYEQIKFAICDLDDATLVEKYEEAIDEYNASLEKAKKEAEAAENADTENNGIKVAAPEIVKTESSAAEKLDRLIKGTASEKERNYIEDKAQEIIEKIDTIDMILADASEGWGIKRIGKAELAILRVAVYEIKYDEEIPYKVAINEALELAKLYCNREAVSYINGVLGRIGREE